MLLALLAAAWGLHLATTPSSPASGTRNAAASVNGGGGGTDNCVQPSSNNGNCQGVFGVSVGTLTGLVPTKAFSLPVTWSNPNNFDILVDTYTVTPTTTKAGCSASSLQTPGKVTLAGANRITVVGNRTATTNVPVTLLNTATNACQGATFTITVNATAVKK